MTRMDTAIRPRLLRLDWLICLLMAVPVLCHAEGPPGAAASDEVHTALQQLWQLNESRGARLELIGQGVPKDAGPTEVVDALSLDDARQRAYDASYLLGSNRAKSSSAEYLARAAWSGVLPSVDLRTARGRQQSTPSSRLDETTGEALASTTQTRKEVYGVISQPLFDLAAVAEIRRTAAVQRATESNESGVRGDVSYDLMEAFYTAVEASLTLKLAQAQQQRLERLGTWVSARAEAGGASGAERERIQARVLAARSSVQDATAQVRQAHISLSKLTGCLPRALVLPTALDMPPVGTLDEALSLVSEGNAAVNTARANEEAAVHERRGQLARFSPVVKLELSDAKIKNDGGVMGWKDDRRAMVVLTMPLFSGGADYYRQRAALAKEEQYRYERMEAERTAQKSLQTAFSGLASARQKIESLRQQAQAQQRVVQAFDAQLSSSTRNLLDVFDAYQQFHQSQLDLLHSSVQAVLLGQQILRVTGRLGQTLAAGKE